jgi:hypothetical protein
MTDFPQCWRDLFAEVLPSQNTFRLSRPPRGCRPATPKFEMSFRLGSDA